MSIRVLIADGEELMRLGFALMLESQSGVEVVALAQNRSQAIELSRRHRPDVVLVDLDGAYLEGIAAIRGIVASEPSPSVIAVASFDCDDAAFDALEAGAAGYLKKDASAGDLLSAVRDASGGGVALPHWVISELVRRYRRLAQAPETAAECKLLTRREREVLKCLLEGLTNAEIGARLWLSESTVKSHVGAVLRKLGVRDRVGAVLYAARYGLLSGK